LSTLTESTYPKGSRRPYSRIACDVGKFNSRLFLASNLLKAMRILCEYTFTFIIINIDCFNNSNALKVWGSKITASFIS